MNEEVIVTEPVWEELEDGTRRLIVGAGARISAAEAKRLGVKGEKAEQPAEDKAVKEPPADKAKTTSSRSQKK